MHAPSVLALVLATFLQQPGPAPSQVWSPTAALVGHAADADRDGRTTQAEWIRFASGLRLDSRGSFDRVEVQAALLRPLLDVDGNGRVARAELDGVRARWDRNGDGNVDAAEFETGAREFDGEATFVQELVLHLADGRTGGDEALRDGITTADEWRAFVDSQPTIAGSDDLVPSCVMTWIASAGRLEFADRNAFSPDVYLLTLAAELDVDKDGAIRPDDLEALVVGLDADGDGTLSSAELAPPPDPVGARPRFERSVEEQRLLPPLAPFQRNLSDALLLVERTGKPLLVCVNMDGENASEELAWYRYRDPAFADLMHGFVCVLASPDRRQPFDHDDRGRRLADERFGRLVDREHIDIEPALYARYFSGTRAAPRHVGVAPDGTILFDIYLVQDLGVIDAALAKHGVRADERPRPAQDLSLDELLASPEHAHRAHLEAYFVEADVTRRLQLVRTALEPARAVCHPELVRLALFDPDARVRTEGAAQVAARPGAVTSDLVLRALSLHAPDSEAHRAILAGLRRFTEVREEATVPDGSGLDREWARRALAAHAGAREASSVVDPKRVAARLAVAPAVSDTTGSAADLEPAIAALKQVEAVLDGDPKDPELLAWYAAACLRCGRATLAGGGSPLFFFQDAKTYAERAGDAGLAHLAWALWLLSDFEGADAAAERALPTLLDRAEQPLALEVLRVFARTRTAAVYETIGANAKLRGELVADVLAAHRAIELYPSASTADALERISFLGALELWRDQSAAVEAAVRRDPASADLHAWLRSVVLRDAGSRGMADAYARLEDDLEGVAVARWYHGVAELFAAEHAVRVRDTAAALEAYEACVRVFEAAVASEPAYVGSAAHYAALARAGAARILVDAGRFEASVAALERAFERALDAPAALDSRDGLGTTPREAVALVRAHLVAEGADAALIERLYALDAG
ncbi:EF hand [Planctomycetes bacterium Pla163]|uniref:EF hand n=1 Tax=Rohdeia mirabilis TaxID=2528008 RepID=A0A518CXH5_9BACT|nr:EF hand [Planctomycetes bacterium Pla163]